MLFRSALNLKIADITSDVQIMQQARSIAEEILDKDPDLNAEENQLLLQQMKELERSNTIWSKIG